MSTVANPFDAARNRLRDAKRRKRARPDAPQAIVPAEPAAPEERLQPSRLEAARTRLRLTIPPKTDD